MQHCHQPTSILTLFSCIAVAAFTLIPKQISAQTNEKFGALSDFHLVDKGLYRGDLRRGKPHGKGLILYFTDDPGGRYNYSGSWRLGKREGRGETMWRNGDKYIGHYSKDREHGRGKIFLWCNGYGSCVFHSGNFVAPPSKQLFGVKGIIKQLASAVFVKDSLLIAIYGGAVPILGLLLNVKEDESCQHKYAERTM